jgi:spore cortex formation protein SpoVR/YcgB (stage V sporulation)
LNFFQWAIKNKIIDYIEEHYDEIEKDMNLRNSTSKNKENIISTLTTTSDNKTKTRKKRQEISLSATKSIKKEDIEITVSFH